MRALTETEAAVVATAQEVAQYHGLVVVGELLVDRHGDPWGVYDFACEVAARLGYEGQPRESGRFAEGKLDKPEDTQARTAAQQKMMRAVPFTVGPDANAAVDAWRAANPQDAAQYEATVDAWSNQENGVMQADLTHGDLSNPDTAALAHYLDIAPPTTAPIFRGCSATATMKPGYEFNLPPSSFTSDKTEGISYAFEHHGEGGGRPHPAVVEVQSGARGVPIGALSAYPEERETIAGGRYQVQSTTMETFNMYGADVSYPHIVVKQVK